ncbi:hypothetical protein GCM10009809_14120 [Isoptericola hypogeus]|uniref:Septum formation-related domain-containing protein n=1 Tax=Isoptericola hypogeus TaxID=300179 RepID=A0ABP4VA48_9MICO
MSPHEPPAPEPDVPEPDASGSAGPDGPTFASPTPPGALPTAGLDDVRLPPPADDSPTAARPNDGATPSGAGPAPTRRPRRRAATLAAGGLVAALLVATGVALGVDAARDGAWAPVSADVTEPREVNAVQLVLGSCVADLPADGPVGRVLVVPCTDRHEAQVVGRSDAEPGAVWPGADDAAAGSARTCGPALLGPEGREEADALRFVVWAPTEASWEAGDRAGLCLAAATSARSGSLLS